MHAVMNENSEVMHVTVKLKRWAPGQKGCGYVLHSTILRVRRRWPCGDLPTSLAESYAKERICHARERLLLSTCQGKSLQ